MRPTTPTAVALPSFPAPHPTVKTLSIALENAKKFGEPINQAFFSQLIIAFIQDRKDIETQPTKPIKALASAVEAIEAFRAKFRLWILALVCANSDDVHAPRASFLLPLSIILGVACMSSGAYFLFGNNPRPEGLPLFITGFALIFWWSVTMTTGVLLENCIQGIRRVAEPGRQHIQAIRARRALEQEVKQILSQADSAMTSAHVEEAQSQSPILGRLFSQALAKARHQEQHGTQRLLSICAS